MSIVNKVIAGSIAMAGTVLAGNEALNAASGQPVDQLDAVVAAFAAGSALAVRKNQGGS